MPDWNQLHLFGMLPEHLDQHVARFDVALRAVKPASVGFDGCFHLLDGIRRRPRWFFRRWIDDLSIRTEERWR
jgi:hypothetical protein